jgi:hypothetical protein
VHHILGNDQASATRRCLWRESAGCSVRCFQPVSIKLALSKKRNTEMTSTLHLSSTALMHRLHYRHGLPFITSVVLAVATTAWPLVRDAFFHQGTSIWTFAMLATVSTAFAMLCGGRYRSFFITIAVTPPFLFLFFFWFLRLHSASLGFPIKPFVEYFLYFVMAPILLVWLVDALVNRKERHA